MRVFTTTLTVRLSVWECTALLVGEYTENDVRERPEFAIADGIIFLHGTEEGIRQERRLRIMKMRGTGFFGGEHAFEINGFGITLYPRMSPVVSGEYNPPTRHLPSLVDGLTEMMSGGLHDSTSCLITGSTGTGKTLLALSFAVPEAKAGRPVLYVSMEESPDQIARNCEAFAWDVAKLLSTGKLEVMHISPSELNVDRHAAVVRDRALEMKASMVVLDSISSFEASVPDPAIYQGYLWAINDHFKRSGITTVMTSESLLSERPAATRHVSLFADAIINLASEETERFVRKLQIVKIRGAAHDALTREFIIEAPRISVLRKTS